MKRLILLAAVLFFGLTGAGPVYSSTFHLYDQWGGTWHDANKTGVDDSLMCWAASAANILDWGHWDTSAYNTETKIFQDIKDHWTNNRGWQSWAWQWWLKGTPPPYKTYAYVNISSGGDYWPSSNIYSYYRTASGSGEIASMDSLMHDGYGISLVITTTSGGSHAITAWGFDYDLIGSTKDYTKIYYTDSDDGVIALKSGNIDYDSIKGWYFTSGYTDWRISGIYGLKENPAVPLPSAILLLGAGLTRLGAYIRRQRSSLTEQEIALS